MKRLLNTHACIVFILMALSFICMGCGVLEKDQPKYEFDPFYDDPYYYKPGDTVRGGDFSFPEASISGYILDEESKQFVEIVDGSHVTPGRHKLGIDAKPRAEHNIIEEDFKDLSELIQGLPMPQRVYVGDGGNEYLVEAEYDEETGLYLCDFEVDGQYLTTSILVEVLYPDGMANKEKIVLTTEKHIKPSLNQVVKEGIGIAINTDFVQELAAMVMEDDEILQVLMGVMGSFLCDYDTAWIEKLLPPVWKFAEPYLTITPGEQSIMDFNLTGPRGTLLGSGGLNLEDLYDDGDQLEGGMGITLPVALGTGDVLGFQVDRLVDVVLNMMMPAITDPISLNFDAIVGPIIDDVIETIFSGMNMTETMEAMLLDTVNKAFPLNITAYTNMFARPEENTASLGVLYLGALLTDTRKLPSPEDLARTGQCFPPWPFETTVNDRVPLDITPIKKDGIDLGIAVSRYQLNGILSQMMNSWYLPLPDSLMNLLTTLIKVENASSELGGKLAFNPQGTTVDFYDSNGEISGLLLAHDMTIELVDNNAPICLMSMDGAFKIRASFRFDEEGDFYIDIGLTLVPELTKIHVVEDTTGLTFIDHSTFGKTILDIMMFQSLDSGNEAREFPISINMTDMIGITAQEEGTSMSAKDGNCYMSMALDNETPIDFFKIEEFASGCFISHIDI